MGIPKATVGAIGGAAADQWKETSVCDEMGSEVLMQWPEILPSGCTCGAENQGKFCEACGTPVHESDI